jgi:hypothetical protein
MTLSWRTRLEIWLHRRDFPDGSYTAQLQHWLDHSPEIKPCKPGTTAAQENERERIRQQFRNLRRA